MDEIVLGKRSMTADIAPKLARLSGVSAGFWLGLQGQYDLDVTVVALGERLERQVSTYADASGRGKTIS